MTAFLLDGVDVTEIVPPQNSAIDILSRDVVGNKTDAASVAATASLVALLRSVLGVGVPSPQQVFVKSITSAANAGLVTVATVATAGVVIDKIVLMALANPADLTSAAIYGGAAQAVAFISAAIATQANLNAADKQVSWDGAADLAVGKLMQIDLLGVGATAVNLIVVVTYHPQSLGGVLA